MVIGILSLLVAGSFFIGFPEYSRYVIYSERDCLVDTLLESRTRTFVTGMPFVVSTWSNGYCIKDFSGLCVVPVHDLPPNMSLTSIDFATSTKMTIAFTDVSSENVPQVQISIDQYGFIDEL